MEWSASCHSFMKGYFVLLLLCLALHGRVQAAGLHAQVTALIWLSRCTWVSRRPTSAAECRLHVDII